jgi:hypothetical protein
MDYEEKLLNELTHIKHREELNSGQHKFIFKQLTMFFYNCLQLNNCFSNFIINQNIIK